MPDKSRNYHGRRRAKRKETTRPIARTASSPAATAPSIPQAAATQSTKPAFQVPSVAKASSKPASPQILRITPVKELKRIGIIAGSMFLILFILAFIIK